MVLMVKASSPSRCRLPPDPPPSKLLSVAFETLTSIIPPEPPDYPDSFFVLVHRLRPLDSFSSDFHSVSLGTLTQAWDFKSPLSDIAINSIGSAVSLRLSYVSNKPCEGIVYVPLWNKSFLRKVHCDVCLLKLYLPQCKDVTLSLTLRMRSSLPLFMEIRIDEYEFVPLSIVAYGKEKPSRWFEWRCYRGHYVENDAKDVSLALVGSSLMVGALMLCSVLLKAKELSLLRCSP
ncbi:hypothetical protein F2Q69_00049052 [Brassica cretica]|uniref:Uncharacterized protein n=1 Tax=Brassica cretica TaxID=69181 RepID=A0A8S9PWQ0_BRACR|nr:hypothetical protein F2Q69_00049052 [Brassica cretica]